MMPAAMPFMNRRQANDCRLMWRRSGVTCLDETKNRTASRVASAGLRMLESRYLRHHGKFRDKPAQEAWPASRVHGFIDGVGAKCTGLMKP